MRLSINPDSSYSVTLFDKAGKPILGDTTTGVLGGRGVTIEDALADIYAHVLPDSSDAKELSSLKMLTNFGTNHFDLNRVDITHKDKLLELYKSLGEGVPTQKGALQKGTILFNLMHSAQAPWHTHLIRGVFDHLADKAPSLAEGVVKHIYKHTPNFAVNGIIPSPKLNTIIGSGVLPVVLYRHIIIRGTKEICEQSVLKAPKTKHEFTWAVDRIAHAPDDKWIFDLVAKHTKADPNLGIERALRTNNLGILPTLEEYGGDVAKGLDTALKAAGKYATGPSFRKLSRIAYRLKTMDLKEAIVEETEAEVGIDLV